MTLSQQAAIVLEAVEQELLRVDGIVRWADSAIVAAEKPASWLLELSALNPSHITDCIGLLRAHAAHSLPLRWRVQIIALAYNVGLLSIASSLPLLFRVLILERKGVDRDSSDKPLVNALVEWDCEEDLGVIAPPLRARFETLLREYLSDAQQVSAVLHWKHESVA